MGMYTSIRGVVRVKAEYIELAEHFGTCNDEELEKDKLKYPFVREYFKTERAEFILSNGKFFSPRVEKDVFLKSDLKNYEVEKRGGSPIFLA